ncbi:MAG: hypothetical protein AAFU64_11270, partial [Bacteroidota bacterium]
MKKYYYLLLLGSFWMIDISQAQIKIPFEKAYDSTLVIKRLPESVNTDYEELTPIISGDGNTLFFIRVGDPANVGGAGKLPVSNRDSVATNQDIWMAKKVNGEWQKAVNLGIPINDDKPNVICGTNEDGSIIFISNQYQKKRGKYKLNPGVTKASQNGDGSWVIVDTIPVVFRNKLRRVDRESHFYFHVVNDSLLLVSKHSNQPKHGNVGEEDIYLYQKSLYNEKKKQYVYEYRNRLGLVVTEDADYETGPFLSPNANKLYFTQGNHIGRGSNRRESTKIYEIARKGKGWEDWTAQREIFSDRDYRNKEAINAGTFNAYLVFESGLNHKGFFSSARDGRDKADIYSFDVISQANPVSLQVKTYDAVSREPLETNLRLNINGKKAIQQFQKDSVFQVLVPEAGTYALEASSPESIQGYAYEKADTSIQIQYREAYEVALYLKPPAIFASAKDEAAFDTVFFAFDRYDKPFYAPIVTSYQRNYSLDTLDANNGQGAGNGLWTIEETVLLGLGKFKWLAKVPKNTNLSW